MESLETEMEDMEWFRIMLGITRSSMSSRLNHQVHAQVFRDLAVRHDRIELPMKEQADQLEQTP